MKKIFFALTIICFSVSLGQAQPVTMTVEGIKQGKFKGESMKGKFLDKMELIGYMQEVASPRDASTGMVRSRRNHLPLVVVKQAGAASTQFFLAVTGNETLTKVVIEVYKTDQQGMQAVDFVITLENAAVSNYRQFLGPFGNDKLTANNIVYDEIKFTFQKITIESKSGKTIATDDW